MDEVTKADEATVAGAFEFRPTPCAVCGSDCPRPQGWRGGSAHHCGAGVRTRIVRCGVCSHLYPNPMPFPALGLDSLYQHTDDYFVNHDLEAKKRGYVETVREIEARLGRKGRLLDVGCGRGELLWAAREEGWDCEGIDPSPAYLEWARQNLGIEARLGTVEEAGYPDGRFSAVTMGGIIEHLYDPLGTLQEVWRILEPGGLLWLDAPNEDALSVQVGNLYMKALGRDWVVSLAPTFAPFHVQGFNRASLMRILTRAGFTIESMLVRGGMFPQMGVQSLRKRLEYHAARLINHVGNCSGRGTYMYVWARKPAGRPETSA
jgi:2-polyprenyl-3-methyl-5-hydroxy-6-metoxy-1,4-benzoquinol methylase